MHEPKQTRAFPREFTVTLSENSTVVFHGEMAAELAQEYAAFKSAPAEEAQ